MNTKIFSAIAIGSCILGAVSCTDNWEPNLDGKKGTLNMEALDVDVSEVEKVISVDTGTASHAPKGRADEAAYDINNFVVKVTDKTTGAQAALWSYSNTPEIATFDPGDYTLEIYSHEIENVAEWERPYFYVSQDFSIEENKITHIEETLVAKLANSAVSVRFDDELLKYAGDDIKVTVVANDGGRLEYTTAETRKGYFHILEGSTTIVVTFTGTVNGYRESVTLPASNLEAGQHRIYTFKVKVNGNVTPDETGSIVPGSGIEIDASVTDEDVDGNITMDEDYETVRPEDRPGYEQPLEPDQPDQPGTDPSDAAATFNPSPDLDLNGVNNFNEFGDGSDLAPGTKKASMTIECPAGVAHIVVDIDSPYLTEEFLSGVQMSTHFDLAEPGDLEDALRGFNLPVKDEVIGKTSVDFDITNLVPLLGIGAEPSDTHNFIITVTDKNGKQSVQKLVFKGE